MSNKTCIVLVGPPCSGKSSIGRLTASKMNIGYISSGDIARKMAKCDNVIENDLNMGKLAPEDKMRNLIYDALYDNFKIHDKDIVILDGFPRFGEQAEWLHNRLLQYNIYYVLVDAPLSTIIERSAHRNRTDDSSLEQRLRYYNDVTFKELRKHINFVVYTKYYSSDECSAFLISYIKEVTDIAKNS